jgi:hypothetical protein
MEKKYIDADAILKWYDDERKMEYDRLSEYEKLSSRAEAKIKIGVLDKLYFKICKLKEQEPAADVQEVRHGKWIEEQCQHVIYRIKNRAAWVKYTCSLCGKKNGRYKSPYCPHCGAIMDGGDE